MHFSFIDKNVNLPMNVFLVIGNIINLIYNLPQIIKTIKTKSTKDFSGWFISLRIVSNVIWIAYAIEINSFLMLINTIVTIISSIIIGSYMIKDIYNEWKLKNYKDLINNNDIDEELVIDENKFNKENKLAEYIVDVDIDMSTKTVTY
jgi:uncharacterized protein with PQ loop repeat